MEKHAHHPFSPSCLKRLKLCPGSFRMEEGISEQDNEYSSEGTLMHEALEKRDFTKLDTNQKQLAEQMIKLVEKIAPFDSWQKEQNVKVFDPFALLTEGSVDAVLVRDDDLIALDYKLGYNRVDSVKDNLQCKAYSLGLMQQYNRPVSFMIIQPRIGFYNTHKFELSDQQLIMDEIINIIQKVKADEMILNTGAEQCRYCKAKHLCPAARKSITNSSLARIEHTSELTTDQIGQYLIKWIDIKKIGENLENQAKLRLQQGEEIPGWALQTRSGTRQVSDPEKFFEIASDFVSINEFLSCVTVSIPKVEKIYSTNGKAKTGQSMKELKEKLTNSTTEYVTKKADSISVKQLT